MICICDIINAPNLADIRVIAGLNGQNREVKTVTVLDAPDGPKWLKGSELILSSAYLFENNDTLMMYYVTQLLEVGASGFGIKMGRFVNSIPPEVEEFANQNNFPILKIPYKLVWTDIISTFYKLQYRLEQPRDMIHYGPESIASLVDALKWNSRRLVERLTELFRIPVLLVNGNGSIQTENAISGVAEVKSLLKSQGFFPENAVREVYERGGFYISAYPVPTFHAKKDEYLILGVSTQEDLREMTTLFELIERLIFLDNNVSHDVTQLYRRFLMRVVSGKITVDEIRSFVKNRAIDGYVYSGIILLTGKNYQKVFDQIEESAKYIRSGTSTALPPRLLYDQAVGEAVVLVEYQSDKPMPNINNWMRGLMLEVEDDLLAEDNGCIAISTMHNTLEEIFLCIREAREALEVGDLLWKHRRKYSYSNLSAYIMLRNADLSQVDFSDIRMLKGNDAFLSFDGVETTETYMECYNYKLAAKRLYIHENTLRHRIQKINELLNLNLEDPSISHSILMKIKLWKLSLKQINHAPS